jgi:hypothetical protein
MTLKAILRAHQPPLRLRPEDQLGQDLDVVLELRDLFGLSSDQRLQRLDVIR